MYQVINPKRKKKNITLNFRYKPFVLQVRASLKICVVKFTTQNICDGCTDFFPLEVYLYTDIPLCPMVFLCIKRTFFLLFFEH